MHQLRRVASCDDEPQVSGPSLAYIVLGGFVVIVSRPGAASTQRIRRHWSLTRATPRTGSSA